MSEGQIVHTYKSTLYILEDNLPINVDNDDQSHE
jgi:hypothetical protein